uniref:1-acylglycerol-3-phosphate O-acyltransferase ABHD5 n=1 Tax=Strigamia maritima TaxID=126957 RepID=T1J514_STRMM
MSEVIAQVEDVGWFGGWLRWCPTSMTALQNAERRLLSYLKTAYSGKYIDIGNRVDNKDNKIWTVSVNEKSDNTPLVLVHGFGAGVGLWILNLDHLAKNRPVYAFDLLGFGRSSRPRFSSDAQEAELQLVDSIEDWRKELKLDKFIILGHSMGGFLASAYSLRYPDRVKQLILADPWGFPESPKNSQQPRQLPLWVKAVVTLLQPFNPLAAVRVAGPWGPRLIEKLRPDLKKKFAVVTDDDSDTISNYIYHCNAQKPSGETAFKVMTESFGWAKRPMINRIGNLRADVPLSIIYGSRSWIDRNPGFIIKQERPDEANVSVHIISGAGHHVYADQSDVFNTLVSSVCNDVDGIVKIDRTQLMEGVVVDEEPQSDKISACAVKTPIPSWSDFQIKSQELLFEENSVVSFHVVSFLKFYFETLNCF